MKAKLYQIALILVLAVYSLNVRATHIIGGELYYTQLDSAQYQITLKIFRDCYNGVPWFDSPARIKVFDGNDSLLFIHTIDSLNWSFLDPYLDSACIIIPPEVCVQEAIYIDTLTLPASETGYQLSYTRCCRNATILNIQGPDSAGITLLTSIPPLRADTLAPLLVRDCIAFLHY